MFDIKEFELKPESLSQMKPKKVVSRRKGNFLKGPIPMDWLVEAAALPGKTLHVGLALWLASGIEKKSRFRFTSKWYGQFEVSRPTVRESLDRLQKAGLIRVEQRPGRAPVVTVLDAGGSLSEAI